MTNAADYSELRKLRSAQLLQPEGRRHLRASNAAPREHTYLREGTHRKAKSRELQNHQIDDHPRGCNKMLASATRRSRTEKSDVGTIAVRRSTDQAFNDDRVPWGDGWPIIATLFVVKE